MFFLLRLFFIQTEKGGKVMTAIRNSAGKIVCFLDETTGSIEIKVKDCTTLIRYKPNGKPEVVNYNSTNKR